MRSRRTCRPFGRSTRSPRVAGQALAEMALSWILRDARISSVLVGASSVDQLEANVRAAVAPPFEADELAAIETALAPR